MTDPGSPIAPEMYEAIGNDLGLLTALTGAMQQAEETRATAEQANREKDALLNEIGAVLDAIDYGILLLGPDLRVHIANRALREMWGFPEEFFAHAPTLAEIINYNRDTGLYDVPEDQWEAYVAQREEAIRQGAVPATQFRRRDGRILSYQALVLPGNSRMLTYFDITDLVRQNEHLADLQETNARLYSAAQETQRRLTDIINFLPDATFVIDAEGCIIAWNRAIEEMTGITATEMLGKGDYEYALPFYGERRPILIDLVFKPQEELEQRYAHIQQLGATLVGETYVPQLRGDAHYLLGTASILRDSQGNPAGAIESIRDITDRKHAEEELHRAKEAAEAATQAKSAFLATMSHEIRTPMNAIIGMSGLLLDTQLSTDQREFADTIRTSGDALLTIINDILDFSKIEAGRMELESQPFNLRECIESALDLMKLKAAGKGLELACEIAAGVPAAIVGDVTRLRQILVNLLGNAVKFTEHGEVVVSVSVDKETSRQVPASEESLVNLSTCLRFSVRDTGIGIPADRLERLFQAFSQVDASTTRKYGGTGLGLAVSKRLSEIMGGTMWVESEGVAGKGSAFHFTIRTAEAAAMPERYHLLGEPPELRGRRLLIVDDNATNRRIVTLQAQGWGLVPCDTASPQEALAWIRRGDPFDLAILDLQMPEMDGINLATRIRALRDAQALPLILLSSLGSQGKDIPPGLFAISLSKPVRASALFDALMGVCGGRPAPTAAPQAVPAHLDRKMAQRLPLRILLAEDYVVNQKLALHMLAQMGYRADIAGNGLEAIQALGRQPYDVVLMDVQMPEMDGLEATRQIRSRWPAGEQPRIVAMTANAMQGDREICLQAGMDDYVSKPIRVDELVQALNRCQPLSTNQVVVEASLAQTEEEDHAEL